MFLFYVFFFSELSPEDINQFLKSDFVASVEDEIRKASHINLTMELFINVRDYVIFRILIANGQRAGAVLSITHDVIKKRQLREEGYVTLYVS